MKEYEAGVSAPPFHPNCRTTTCPYFEDDYGSTGERAMRGENGTEFVPSDMTYNDWAEIYLGNTNEHENSNKYIDKNTVINKSYINSSKYRERFNLISDDIEVQRATYSCAKEILNHRSGTQFEDLAFIDIKTGEYSINKDYSKKGVVTMNRTLNKMLKTAQPKSIVAVHNHPNSSLPSAADLIVCNNRNYKFGIVVGHNGSIYKYSVNAEKFNVVNANMALDIVSVRGYNEKYKEILFDAGVDLDVL